jgi:predicted esterase
VTAPGYDSFQTAIDQVTFMGTLRHPDVEVTLDRAGAATRMVRLPEQAGASRVFGRRSAMPAFEIDRFEVTNREFKEFIDGGGYQGRHYWNVAFVDQGRTLSWEQAMARFVDPTGRPGPSTWEAGTYAPGQDNYPVSGVSWYEAAAYAEFRGKSLPTVAHWLRASNLDVVASDYRFLIPLSNLQSSQAWAVASSNAVNSWGLFDVAGNVREWCWNESGGRRAILGGSWADQVRDARVVDNAAAFDRSAINGFRLARYADARQVLGDFGGPVSPATRPDYNKVKPVSNEVFEVYKRLYAYDTKPLDPVVESIDESSGLWRREKIRFTAPYGNEQEIAYLFLPRQNKPPYHCLVYMGDGATLRPGSGDTIQPDHSVLRSGRAMIYPIYKGTLDRYVQMGGDPVARRDMVIAWRKDLGSAIDYLQTRADIDATKLAYMGHSMGTRLSPTILANEARFEAAVLLAGGLEAPGALPRVTVPVLLVAGQYDPAYPVESAQKPMIALLGTPSTDKRHVILPVGHAILVPEVRATVMREVLDWLDRYLGRP